MKFPTPNPAKSISGQITPNCRGITDESVGHASICHTDTRWCRHVTIRTNTVSVCTPDDHVGRLVVENHPLVEKTTCFQPVTLRRFPQSTCVSYPNLCLTYPFHVLFPSSFQSRKKKLESFYQFFLKSRKPVTGEVTLSGLIVGPLPKPRSGVVSFVPCSEKTRSGVVSLLFIMNQ